MSTASGYKTGGLPTAATKGIETMESIPGRRTELGSLEILRALPRRQRRMVGPWCFLDRYGPIRFTEEKAMDVAPHPHIGLQTVSWLVSGEIIHKDSLGCEAIMHAGQLNLMTAGAGIAHSEETPDQNSGELQGVQLWIALPDDQRQMLPQFGHYSSVPVFNMVSTTVTVFMGEILGYQSPAKAYSPIIGAEIAFVESGIIDFPLNANFEHAFLVLHGNAFVEDHPLNSEALHYIAPGLAELRVRATPGCRMLLIGGEPFREPILMWWNFVARTHEEMAAARQDWIEQRRFGNVKTYHGERLPAPALATLAPPNLAS